MNGKIKLIQILIAKQHDSKKSWNQICKKIGLSPSVVSKFIHTQSDISVESLNKLLRYFNVDIYHSAKNSLENRRFDSTTKVKVIGVSDELGIIQKPRLSDPLEVLRSNIWRGYHAILVKHDPVYDYQCLFDPVNDFTKKPQKLSNQFIYSILKYKLPQKNSVYVFCNAKFDTEKNQINCLDEVTKTMKKIDKKYVQKWFVIEALFAPNYIESSRVNNLNDQIYNQKKF